MVAAPAPAHSLHRYAVLVELFAAQKELFVAVTRRMEIVRKPGWDDRVQIHLTLPSQELDVLAQGVFPEYPNDMCSFNPTLCLSLVIIRLGDGKWLKLCRTIPPENTDHYEKMATYPGLIYFLTTPIDHDLFDPFWSVCLDLPHEYGAGRYVATGASLEFLACFTPMGGRTPAHDLGESFVEFWDEQGTWV